MKIQRHSLAARAFALAARLSNALLAWPNHVVPPPFRLMQIGSAFWQSRALYAAATLDIATILGDDGLTVAALAQTAKADPRALGRLLRMLAAIGVFAQTAPGIFRNNKLSHALRSDRPGNVRAIVMMHNSPEMSRPWFEQLEAGIRLGEVPFERTHGTPFFDYMDAHPQFDGLFSEAMGAVDALAGDSYAWQVDWRRFDRVIDVGGSKGAKAVTLLRRHPHLKALVVDREPTIRGAAEYWMERGAGDCLSRLGFEPGDVFGSVPTAANGRDAYLLSAVLHCFDDDTAIRALEVVARAAAPAQATIILLELVLPDSGADLTAAAIDMQMLMATRGGERTRAEWEHVFAGAGVRLAETVHLASFAKALVLKPVV
ncbi:MAG TPA: methyltransferase [Magnetospirillum sp.]|jgi:hypothetical protein|nr:methyltransferase [Magnetospirillum sp.]